MAGNRVEAGRVRVWPGVAAPVGLTLLLAVAVWLFAVKIAADRDEIEANALRRESYARLEAEEIAASAKKIAGAFIDARAAERRNQGKNLHFEARGILDSVYRLMTAILDRARKNSVSRREIGRFPPGFDGIRSFLEIVPPGDDDESLAALRAANPELSALLPAGCSLTVVEDDSRQLFSLGGGVSAEGAITAVATRDFIFNDGGRSRLWSLRVETTSPDKHPPPDAAAVAEHLSSLFGERRLDGVSWRGWLLNGDGQAAAVFGPAPGSDDDGGSAPEAPPYVDTGGEWMNLDGNRLVWLQKAEYETGLDWLPAVAVAMAQPDSPPDPVDAFFADSRWSITLCALALLAAAGWALFARAMLASRRISGAAGGSPAGHGAAVSRVESSLRQKRTLVKDAAASSRAIPDVEGRMIVADIGDDGRVRLDESILHLLPLVGNAANRLPSKPKTIPSGSLFRLQAIHRGREGQRGSRVLDQARSQVLRELASRVRPALPTDAQTPDTAGKQAGVISSMKSPMGWKRVE